LAAACCTFWRITIFYLPAAVSAALWVIHIWGPLGPVLNHRSNGYEASGDDDKFNI
jgi:hypothetical protein